MHMPILLEILLVAANYPQNGWAKLHTTWVHFHDCLPLITSFHSWLLLRLGYVAYATHLLNFLSITACFRCKIQWLHHPMPSGPFYFDASIYCLWLSPINVYCYTNLYVAYYSARCRRSTIRYSHNLHWRGTTPMSSKLLTPRVLTPDPTQCLNQI